MPYIAPDSDIWILRGINCDRGYNHTVRHPSAESQFLFFEPYTKYHLTEQSYQRTNSNRVRVSILADNLYDCNYLMFRNSAFGNKVFYAFIDSVEYVNNNVSYVYYSIDVMQTWFFDFEVGECFVEREHSSSDEIGENVIPEDFGVGDLIIQRKTDMPLSKYNCVVIQYVPNEKYIDISDSQIIHNQVTWDSSIKDMVGIEQGRIRNGMYMGTKSLAVEMRIDNIDFVHIAQQTISSLIRTLISISANIVSMTIVPEDFYLSSAKEEASVEPLFWDFDIPLNKAFIGVDNQVYEPKNNKLFTYPFTQLMVSNNSGQTATFKWEYFNSFYSDNPRATFSINGSLLPQTELLCFPTNYRHTVLDYESGLMLNQYPTCSWSEDSFSRWWAQNGETFILSQIVSVIQTVNNVQNIGANATVGTAAGIASGNAVGAISSAASGALGIRNTGINLISNALNAYGQILSLKNAPDQLAGQTASQAIKILQERMGYTAYQLSVNTQTAKMIDNFFSMYGYAVKSIKKPNIFTSGVKIRNVWNYVKTQNTSIHHKPNTGMNKEDEEKIQNILERGITFWQSNDVVGDYSLDNTKYVTNNRPS